MGISNQDDILASVQPAFMFYKAATTAKAIGTPHAIGLKSAGMPAAFTPGSPGLAGANIDGTTSTLGGTFPFINPGVGNTYLSKFCPILLSNVISIKLFDFIWYNSGINATTTTAQTINSVTFPARDNNGATSGVGYTAYLYSHVATGNGAAITNTTLSYTNSSGTSGQTATLQMSFPATATSGTIIPFNLAGNDVGIQSIQSITLGTSYVSGTIFLIVARDLINIPFLGSGAGQIFDWGQTGLPQLYNGTALSFYGMPFGTAIGQTFGDIAYVQG